MKNIRKLLSTLLCAVMAVTICPIGSFAAEFDEPQFVNKEIYYDDDGLEYQRYVNADGNEIFLDEIPDDGFETSSVTIPSKWDSRDKNWVTSVKNQNPFGTCWSFAFCSVAESSLISQGYETADSVDLSEAHLAYFRKASHVDGSNIPVEQDMYTTVDNTFTRGGNSIAAIATVSKWSGFAKESDFPYSKNQSDMEFDSKDIYVHDYELVSSTQKSDSNSVKSAIMKNGAVVASYYHDDSKLCSEYYYQNEMTGTNHLITIVGWDDSIPASMFATAPEGDGAWLVKNSWGKYWGNKGYFWMSYYEASLGYFRDEVVRPAGTYDHNYQYDGVYTSAAMSYGSSTTVANIFTANGNEKIKGCSFNTYNTASNECVIKVYTGLTDSEKPDSGTLVRTQTVQCSETGFYTIDFDSEYEVRPNEKFSIVVQYKSSSGNAFAPVENNSSSTTASYTCGKGESFYSNGRTWTDCYNTTKYKNFPIKAYTVDAKEKYNGDALLAKENSGAMVDNTEKIISGVMPGTIDLNDYVDIKDGYRFEYNGKGTGSEIKIFDSDNQQVDVYYLLIRGDINGDGLCDGMDAVLATAAKNNMLTEEQMTKLPWIATDYDGNGYIEYSDIDAIAYLGINIKLKLE